MIKAICDNRCDNNGLITKCLSCESLYCVDCFKSNCPKCNEPIEMPSKAETGPIQFGEDWPGLFIRGDDCFNYFIHLKQLINGLGDSKQSGDPYYLSALILKNLLNQLESTSVSTCDQQILKDFNKCKE